MLLTRYAVRTVPRLGITHVRSISRLGLQHAAKKSARSVEDEYKRLTPLEHILKCPNMYIGATSLTEKTKLRYVATKIGTNKVTLERVDTPYIPGLVKLFDEVLVNACDNAVRDSKGTTQIDVTYDAKNCIFSVRNNGAGIPVKLHAKEKMYIPELVLGHLLTGSNFEKAEANATGGRHGYGAKLCNVFSKEFSVETVDATTGKHFFKKWKDNMTPDGDAIIKNALEVEPFTQVIFKPDLSRFGLNRMEPGSLTMIQTRVVETAGLLGPRVRVTWNGKPIPINSFQSFAEACFDETAKRSLFFSNPSANLRVGLGLSEDGFIDASFVNSMSTWRGGSHVDSVVTQVAEHVIALAKKNGVSCTERDVKRHLAVFLDFRTNHPEFDSQSKERLTNSLAGDKSILLPDTFIRNFIKESEIITALKTTASAKVTRQVNKRVAINAIPKLEDAFKAGTAENHRCTLILTEGDSAKALAMEGISVVGRQYYGVFPLRGKLLNVRDKTIQDVAENREIVSIMNALGLKIGTTNFESLRYGRVMFMTDQDHDGSHIKGLLLNLFDQFWPELAQKDGFLTQFITPLLKAKPRQSNKPTLEFYNQDSFNAWANENPSYQAEYKIKYYKGLGTSTAQEAREYFSKLDKHIVDFVFSRGKADRELIDKIFKAERAAERKEWLKQFRHDETISSAPTAVPPKTKSKAKSKLSGDASVLPMDSVSRKQTIEDFINKDVASFSWHDVERSIASAIDGFKPSQRKIFFALLQKTRGSAEEIKVAQLAGYVAEVTAYHHGEKSLVDAIINMAQDFVGSNNIPLLRSEGQFGTRLQGGKDAAAGRYIFTGLSPVARLLFPVEDDPLLERRTEDGVEVEPRLYVPILPMALINGSQGIGTGWSSFVPAFNPLELMAVIRYMIENHGEFKSITDLMKTIPKLSPWYRGWTGDIDKIGSGDRYNCHGTMTLEQAKTKTKQGEVQTQVIRIRELPIGVWTDDFKEKLIEHVTSGRLSDFKDESEDPSSIDFILYSDDTLSYYNQEKPRFRTTLDLRNMHLFDAKGSIKRYSDVCDLLHDFYQVRMDLYGKRRGMIIERLQHECSTLSRELELTRVVVLSNEKSKAQILGRSIADFTAELSAAGFTQAEIDRFLRKSIIDLTSDRVLALEQSLKNKRGALEEYRRYTPEMLWLKDLDKLESVLQKFSGYVSRLGPLPVQSLSSPKVKDTSVKAAKTASSSSPMAQPPP